MYKTQTTGEGARVKVMLAERLVRWTLSSAFDELLEKAELYARIQYGPHARPAQDLTRFLTERPHHRMLG